MRPLDRLLSRSWIIVLLLALAMTLWVQHARMLRVQHVTGLARETPVLDSESRTGYAGGSRDLIVPEHALESYQWISETQEALAEKAWRMRHVDTDNAPQGRATHTPAPYRWWLAGVATVIASISHVPTGVAVERAALWSDVVLHALLLVGATGYVARYFGGLAACFLCLGSASLYPFAASFLPGVPSSFALSLVCLVASVLPLLVACGMQRQILPRDGDANATTLTPAKTHAIVAGLFGAVGIWVNVALGLQIFVALALAALIGEFVFPSAGNHIASRAIQFRWWGLSGAVGILAAFLFENFPAELASWRLNLVHPVYALSWLGFTELQWLFASRQKSDTAKNPEIRRRALTIGHTVVAVLLISAAPLALWWTRGSDTWPFTSDLNSVRLTFLPDGIAAPSVRDWLVRDGLSAKVLVTLAPLALALGGAWLVLRRDVAPGLRAAIVIAFGPVAAAAIYAAQQLHGWAVLDAALLCLGVALVASVPTFQRHRLFWTWGVGLVCAALFLTGLTAAWPQWRPGRDIVLTLAEAETLIERDLAQWLAKRAGKDANKIVLLAPPASTTSLSFYGGFRGVGTFSPENTQGLAAAVRMISATSFDEVRTLMENREITHVALPSWDAFFQQYAESRGQASSVWFLRDLERWSLPLWLRAVPYQIPGIGGLDTHHVILLEVVEEQDESTATSRLAEFFVEVGQMSAAMRTAQHLTRFPGDLGALVARAQVAKAAENDAEFGSTLETLLKRLTAGGDRIMPVDRRLSLAVILARGGKMEPARAQLQKCLAALNEPALRSLSTASLYHLHVLLKAFELRLPKPELQQLSLDLLPRELREKL